MTKKKHPANRFERLKIKERIKQFGKGSTDRPGHIRRKLARETEEAKEFEHEILAEQVREEATREERVAGLNNI